MDQSPGLKLCGRFAAELHRRYGVVERDLRRAAMSPRSKWQRTAYFNDVTVQFVRLRIGRDH